MKVYVDTNVLVDFVCNRQGFVEEAKKLFYSWLYGRI